MSKVHGHSIIEAAEPGDEKVEQRVKIATQNQKRSMMHIALKFQ